MGRRRESMAPTFTRRVPSRARCSSVSAAPTSARSPTPTSTAICSGDILRASRPTGTRLLPEFLPFLVQSDEFFDHALGTSAGSLSPRTNWRDLAQLRVRPPAPRRAEAHRRPPLGRRATPSSARHRDTRCSARGALVDRCTFEARRWSRVDQVAAECSDRRGVRRLAEARSRRADRASGPAIVERSAARHRLSTMRSTMDVIDDQQTLDKFVLARRRPRCRRRHVSARRRSASSMRETLPTCIRTCALQTTRYELRIRARRVLDYVF